MLGQKQISLIIKRLKIYSMFFNCNRNKLYINNKRILENHQIFGNSKHNNNKIVKEEITKEIRKYFELNNNENTCL